MTGTSKPMFAHVRIHRVMSLNYLVGQERHARRDALGAELRPGAVPGASIFWSRYNSASGDYVNDFKNAKLETGARERAGAALGLHSQIGISPEWFTEYGELHDPGNHRLTDAFREAKAWAEQHLGLVYAMRMDLDERGGGVIDCYSMPIHVRQARLRKDGTRAPGVIEISVKSALSAMQKATRGGRSFSSAQTLWARHAHDHLDRRLVRGEPKRFTGREHLSVIAFRQSKEAERKTIELRDGQLVTMQSQNQNWLEVDARQREREAEIEQRQLDLARRKADFERVAAKQEQEYVNWAAERFGYESSLTVRYSQFAMEESAGQLRLEAQAAALAEERMGFEVAQHRDHLSLVAREQAIFLVQAKIEHDTATLARSEAAFQRTVSEHERQYTAWAAERFSYESRLTLQYSQFAAEESAGQSRLEAQGAALVVERKRFEAAQHQASLALRAREEEILLDGFIAKREKVELARDRQSVASRAAAFETGIALVSAGVLSTAADIDGRGDLAPARDLLARAVNMVRETATSATHEATKREAEAAAARDAALKAEDLAKRVRVNVRAVVRSAEAVIAGVDRLGRPLSGPLAVDIAGLRGALDALSGRSPPVAVKDDLER